MAVSTINRATQLRSIKQITANSSVQITVPANYRAIWVVIGTSNTMGLWLVNSTSGAVATIYQVGSQSSISASASGNIVTISNSSANANPTLYANEFAGAATA